MSKESPNPKKLAEFAETDAIRKLLGGVTRRGGKTKTAPKPAPEPVADEPRPPEVAFVGNELGEIVTPESPSPLQGEMESPPPLPTTAETGEPRGVSPGVTNPKPTPLRDELPPPVPQPIGALSFGDFLARINWRNRPDEIVPLPLIGVPGYADSVEGILSAFNWDDE